jgi:bifunctional non-homologous end joining protein LigD
MLPVFQPLPVVRRPRPFNASDWLFELKYDGFRALAYVDYRGYRLVSRNGHGFASFAGLASSIANSVEGTTAVFDGEIVCVDRKGRPRFNDLLFRRGEARFFAFDLLYLDGKDLRYDQLADRKAALRKVLNSRGNDSGLQYADHVSGSGVALFDRVCEMDLGVSLRNMRPRPISLTTRFPPGTKSKILAIPRWRDGMNYSSKSGTANRYRAGTAATWPVREQTSMASCMAS